ncbi:MAG: translation initiation factor IF-3 [candidate division Zixibacteria bacterium]|nr:translation initiation factor IF-3 [candidate division Zixibacteria bacterium]
MRAKEIRVNRRIRFSQVRVIGENGEQIGIMPTRDAIKMAAERGYDLVEVSPGARPPVCKILDYGKYKYELSKKAKDAKKKQRFLQLKEMRFRPKIDDHDYTFKMRHVREFLTQGNKVKVLVVFRGRERAHMEFGQKILDKLKADLSAVGEPGPRPKMEGRILTLIFVPKTQEKSPASS